MSITEDIKNVSVQTRQPVQIENNCCVHSLAFQMMIRTSTKIAFNTFMTLPKASVRYFSVASNPLINVEVNDQNGIAYVTLNRKPVNGINLELFEGLSTTLDDLENNKTRGMILTSVKAD